MSTDERPQPLPFSETYLGKLRSVVGARYLQSPAFRFVLEREDGKILFQHRRDFGVWGLPGGHPEEGETIEDGAVREVLEETGLRVLDFDVYGFTSDPQTQVTTYPNGHVIHAYALLFHSQEWTGSLDESNDESLALEFLDPENPPKMLPSERHSLKLFLKYKRTGAFQLR